MKRLMPFLAAAAAAAALTVSAATAAPEHHAPNTCFASNNWTSWSSPGGGNVLLLRVGLHDIYRVELSAPTRVRYTGDMHLVNRVHGSDWICSALDLNLTLADHNGFRQPLIATGLRKLTPAEVAAIPRKDLPA